jgi:hypothetical protein
MFPILYFTSHCDQTHVSTHAYDYEWKTGTEERFRRKEKRRDRKSV